MTPDWIEMQALLREQQRRNRGGAGGDRCGASSELIAAL